MALPSLLNCYIAAYPRFPGDILPKIADISYPIKLWGADRTTLAKRCLINAPPWKTLIFATQSFVNGDTLRWQHSCYFVVARQRHTDSPRCELTPHLSPLTSHLSPLTSHPSPLTSHPSPLYTFFTFYTVKTLRLCASAGDISFQSPNNGTAFGLDWALYPWRGRDAAPPWKTLIFTTQSFVNGDTLRWQHSCYFVVARQRHTDSPRCELTSHPSPLTPHLSTRSSCSTRLKLCVSAPLRETSPSNHSLNASPLTRDCPTNAWRNQGGGPSRPGSSSRTCTL